jgi:hypothetical protein
VRELQVADDDPKEGEEYWKELERTGRIDRFTQDPRGMVNILSADDYEPVFETEEERQAFAEKLKPKES